MIKYDKTILLVEDEESILETMYQVFSIMFEEVLTATNGKEGLEVYIENKEDIDLILTDINMPIMNGFEMISKIKEIDNKLPIYVISGNANLEKDCDEKGIRYFFHKPLMLHDLIKKITEDEL